MASDPTAERKLAAILMADVVGYSRLMGEDEGATVAAIAEARGVFAVYAARARGRIVNAPGDSILAEFGSVVDAVAAAVEIQRELAERNAPLPTSRQMAFRIGINLGDVIVQDEALYGDGVNIAARLEGIAEPGGICVSRNVYDQVKARLPVEFDYLGEHQVKNIAEPVRVYRLLSKPGAAAHRVISARRALSGVRRRLLLAAAAAILLAGAGIWGWQVWSPAPDPAGGSLAGLPTIAVLPFANLSGDPEQEYFADGITEDLITLLAQFRDLAVIARNSTFTYKGRAVDVRTVGEEMGADFVLEGSLRRSADRIRVTAQLLDAADGKHLWAETYNRELTAGNMFQLQDELTLQVANAVAGGSGIVSMSRFREIARVPPEDIRSYDCVLRVHEYNRLQSPESHLVARSCLERVVATDPGYVDAWAWLAWIHLEGYGLGFNVDSTDNPLGRAGEAIRHAAELEPFNPLVILMDAYNLYHHRDPRYFERAREASAANPGDAVTLGALGVYMAWAGEWEEGLGMVERAYELTSILPGWYLYAPSVRAFFDGHHERALALAEKADLPGFYWHHIHLGINLARLGRTAEAAQQAKLIAAAHPGFERNARPEIAKWIWEENHVTDMIAALREAGMNIPLEAGAEPAN